MSTITYSTVIFYVVFTYLFNFTKMGKVFLFFYHTNLSGNSVLRLLFVYFPPLFKGSQAWKMRQKLPSSSIIKMDTTRKCLMDFEQVKCNVERDWTIMWADIVFFFLVVLGCKKRKHPLEVPCLERPFSFSSERAKTLSSPEQKTVGEQRLGSAQLYIVPIIEDVVKNLSETAKVQKWSWRVYLVWHFSWD